MRPSKDMEGHTRWGTRRVRRGLGYLWIRAMDKTYFRSGLGLKAEVRPIIDAEYQSGMVELIRSKGFQEEIGDVTVRLAKQFGFCYGVDRAVDYAYETRHKFPDKKIFLMGEIIHNPHVNDQLRAAGIRFLSDPGESLDQCGANDVVILPAFGVTVTEMRRLQDLGCTLVDTTCGSVLHVWKRVEAYARDGFTSVIHGKYFHEETRATSSQVLKYPDGRYLVVRDMDETDLLCAFIRGEIDAAAPRVRRLPSRSAWTAFHVFFCTIAGWSPASRRWRRIARPPDYRRCRSWASTAISAHS